MVQTLLTSLNTASRDDMITLQVFREDMNLVLCQQNELVTYACPSLLHLILLHIVRSGKATLVSDNGHAVVSTES